MSGQFVHWILQAVAYVTPYSWRPGWKVGDVNDSKRRGHCVILCSQRSPDYAVSTSFAPRDRVALIERLYPKIRQSLAGNDIEPAFPDYALPPVSAIRLTNTSGHDSIPTISGQSPLVIPA